MPNRFSKKLRLRSKIEFQHHFKKQPKKFTNSCFTVLVKTNSFEMPRLGVSLSKKNIPHAVDRNRIKRIIRESFRLNQEELPAVDIVVIGKRGAEQINNAVIKAKLEKQWQEISNFYPKKLRIKS